MRKKKFNSAKDSLLKRIKKGDYNFNGIPSERDLVDEIGVSRMTLRKAIQQLIDQDILYRLPNGRLEIKNPSSQLQIALLSPAFPSIETQEWHIALSILSRKYDFILKPVYYYHDDDPVINNTVGNFDCSFILPPVPNNFVVKGLEKAGKPFFILNGNWSLYNVPSILLFPPMQIRNLLDHLASLGHTRIDCLNIQPGVTVIRDRMNHWQNWLQEKGFQGKLYNEQVPKFSNTYPASYNLINNLIAEGEFDSKALLCITESAAMGAMCAMIDHGITPGVDIAVCLAGTGEYAEYFRPSITSLNYVDPIPFLEKCIQWVINKEETWHGPLLLQPENIEVAIRESTVPGFSNNESKPKLI